MVLLAVTGLLVLSYALVFTLQALLLKKVAEWINIEDLTYRRALLTVVAVAAVCLCIAVPATILRMSLDEASLGGPDAGLSGLQRVLSYLVFALEIAGACLIVRWLWKALWDQVVLAALVNLVCLLGAGYFLNVLVRVALVETVIVPAGGMAPAVRGLHATVVCPNCGCSYPVGMAERMQAPPWSPRKPKSTFCPNCRREKTISAAIPVQQGERILVDKHGDIRRFELVVLRHARKAGVLLLDRVVGLPGETVEIVGGDVFIDGRRLRRPPETARDMWLPVHDSSCVPAQPTEEISQGDQRPAERWPGIDATRDSAGVPEEVPGWRPASAGSKWRQLSGRWTVTASGAAEERLVFAGPIQDDLAYNDRLTGEQQGPAVGDIRLECAVENCSCAIEIYWAFLHREVSARISPSGEVRLAARDHGDGASPSVPPREVEGFLTGGLQGGAEFDFVQRDGQAYIAQYGRILASVEVGPEEVNAMRRRLSGIPRPRCQLELAARNGSTTFRRLVLFRDVYYRDSQEMPGASPGAQVSPSVPVPLPAGTFFVLGDNSARSEDSRSFGPVSSLAITGTAGWVYWPPARWRRLH